MSKQAAKEPGNPSKMKDYSSPSLKFCSSSIKIPKIEAPFEINPQIIQIIQSSVQFHGFPHEDPYNHIADFLQICNTFKVNGVSDDEVKLILFPFSLANNAKEWLYYSLEPESITTWDLLVHEFLAEYFPAGKTIKLRLEIMNFCPYIGEPLYIAWRRYKVLLRKCPHHGLPLWTVVQIFYFSLECSSQLQIDATAGGSIMDKTPEEGYALLQRIAANDYAWATGENREEKVRNPIEVLAAKLDSLSHQLGVNHSKSETA